MLHIGSTGVSVVCRFIASAGGAEGPKINQGPHTRNKRFDFRVSTGEALPVIVFPNDKRL